MSYGTVTYGDDKYEVMVPFDVVFDGDPGVAKFTSNTQKQVVMLCDHCKNFRLEPYVCYSWDEMLKQGWIVKIPKEA